MLRWIASDWYLEGADKCNSSNSCSRSTGWPSISKFPQGFWLVKSVRAWAASLIEVNPVRICTDGEPGSWAIARFCVPLGGMLHQCLLLLLLVLLLLEDLRDSQCRSRSWSCDPTWTNNSRELWERRREWIDSHFCSCFFVDSLAFSWHVFIREIINNDLSKTTDEVGCLNTLMNSLNEVISVTLAQSSTNT